MLHVVLILLKIIGIVLISLLGLLLVIVLAVLFIPIRYKLRLQYIDSFVGAIKVSWFFRIITFRILYIYEPDIVDVDRSKKPDLGDFFWKGYKFSTGFRMRLRIFGKIFYDNIKSEAEKSSPTKKKSGKAVKRNNTKKKIKGNERKAIQKQNKKIDTISKEDTNKLENKTIVQKVEKEIISIEETKGASEIKKVYTVVEKSEVVKKQIIDKNDQNIEISQINNKEVKQKKIKIIDKFGMFGDKIKKILSSIKDFFSRVKEFFRNIKISYEKVIDNFDKYKVKYEKIKGFIQSQNNKDAFKKIFNSIKKLIKHIRPKKVDAFIEFGSGDPYTTGQALGVAAVFYGVYKDSIRFVPNFEEQRLEGRAYCTGRIRIFTILIISLKLIIDENFKRLIKNFKMFKEDF